MKLTKLPQVSEAHKRFDDACTEKLRLDDMKSDAVCGISLNVYAGQLFQPYSDANYMSHDNPEYAKQVFDIEIRIDTECFRELTAVITRTLKRQAIAAARDLEALGIEIDDPAPFRDFDRDVAGTVVALCKPSGRAKQ